MKQSRQSYSPSRNHIVWQAYKHASEGNCGSDLLHFCWKTKYLTRFLVVATSSFSVLTFCSLYKLGGPSQDAVVDQLAPQDRHTRRTVLATPNR